METYKDSKKIETILIKALFSPETARMLSRAYCQGEVKEIPLLPCQIRVLKDNNYYNQIAALCHIAKGITDDCYICRTRNQTCDENNYSCPPKDN